MKDKSAPPSLVEVTRGALVESRHRGRIIALNARGETVARLGKASGRTWFRSAAKPFQSIPIIVAGAAERYALTPLELAVINGSHSGEAFHLEAVTSILRKAGLDETALGCGSHVPFDAASARALRASNDPPRPLHNNCSGKHAGMLLLARHLELPIETYLDPSHPVQKMIRVTLARFADLPVGEIEIAIDGCSAPVFGLPLEAMARSYAQLVGWGHTDLDEPLREAASRVVSAMTEHPEMVGGTSARLDTDLMRATAGALVAKVGAEGVQLLGIKPCPQFPEGLGIAIKIEDGDTRRARDPVAIETLRQLGLLTEEQVHSLERYHRVTLRNHRGIEVGAVQPAFKL